MIDGLMRPVAGDGTELPGADASALPEVRAAVGELDAQAWTGGWAEAKGRAVNGLQCSLQVSGIGATVVHHRAPTGRLHPLYRDDIVAGIKRVRPAVQDCFVAVVR